MAEELTTSTLKAMRFAELARALIKGSSQLDTDDKILSALALVSDEVIETAALPFFRSELTAADAGAVSEFFSSIVGKAIAAKLVESNFSQLTDQEERAFSRFQVSAAGVSLQRFLGNPYLLPALVEAVGAHAP